MKVKQTVQVSGVASSTYQVNKSFVITGERYSLNPQDILSVFPPPDSQGDHGNILAHVILRRSSLPWERLAQSDQKFWPWLAVLLFDEAEAPAPRVIDLKTLFGDESASCPDRKNLLLLPDPGEHEEDRVTVIDVPAVLLREIAPKGEELALLAHVRQWTSETGLDIGGEQAVVMGNRLPRRGRTSVAHLVSVEGRYQQGELFIDRLQDDRLVRLVSLKSWRFSCLEEKIGGHTLNFTGMLQSVDVDQLRLPEKALRRTADNAEIDAAKTFLSLGFLPVLHHLRTGSETISWYHGPLIPAKNNQKTSLRLPSREADAMLGYDPRYGLYDISYAAAWELGRLLALQDSSFSLALYHWKRALARQQKDASSADRFEHLPFRRENTTPDIPDTVSHWLSDLSLLKGIPFDYLVPDERMLPQESLRLFHVDPDWVACLLDGAFSIGRVSSSDHDREKDLYEELVSLFKQWARPVVGLLLRSDVVAGWPNLQVHAYPARDDNSIPSIASLTLLRMERLSANVLLYLFTGPTEEETTIQMLTIHQKPEGLHSGLTVGDGQTDAGYHKNVRKLSGEEGGASVPATFRDQASGEQIPPLSRVLQIRELAKALQQESAPDTDPNAAAFALQMVEGVAEVRLVVEPPGLG